MIKMTKREFLDWCDIQGIDLAGQQISIGTVPDVPGTVCAIRKPGRQKWTRVDVREDGTPMEMWNHKEGNMFGELFALMQGRIGFCPRPDLTLRELYPWAEERGLLDVPIFGSLGVPAYLEGIYRKDGYLYL